MDLDCFGSMALIKYLYPDHQLIQSQLVHPSARKLYNLYQNRFHFLQAKDLKNETVEEIIVVDTRSRSGIQEYFPYIENFNGKIKVYDHHPADKDDIENAEITCGRCGASTTLVGLEIIEKGIPVEQEDATVALAGIYSDTGNFQHENVTDSDFLVAGYLMQRGASVALVRKFLKILTEEQQVSLFHDILNRLTYKNINGHLIILSYIEIENQIGGLAAVIEKIFEVERAEAVFCMFHFKNNCNNLIISRSNKSSIKVNKILQRFGGGGHEQASSALVKNRSGLMVYAQLEEHIKKTLRPAAVAEEIMKTEVEALKETMTLMKASKHLEKIGCTGMPVLNQKGELVGFMTLRDISKGRKNGQMHSSVKSYMSQNVITATRDTTIWEIEETLFQNNIGHLPIVQGKSLIGLVSRTEYLDFINQPNEQ